MAAVEFCPVKWPRPCRGLVPTAGQLVNYTFSFVYSCVNVEMIQTCLNKTHCRERMVPLPHFFPISGTALRGKGREQRPLKTYHSRLGARRIIAAKSTPPSESAIFESPRPCTCPATGSRPSPVVPYISLTYIYLAYHSLAAISHSFVCSLSCFIFGDSNDEQIPWPTRMMSLCTKTGPPDALAPSSRPS